MTILKNKIVLIGAGNAATQIGQNLKKKGFVVAQVYSHTLESAKKLGKSLRSDYTNQTDEIVPDADIYLFSVKDSVLPELIKRIKPKNGLWLHTAGSIPADIFAAAGIKRYGVIYPLQTFSKTRAISFTAIPLFIEANNADDELFLKDFASVLSKKVFFLSSEKREYLHLAAVFACNFTNHIYVNAIEIIEKEGLSKELLIPLITETANKIKKLNPKEAQTGPAVRYDRNVIDKQLDLLKNDPEKYELYKMLSEGIYRKSQLPPAENL